MLCAHRNIFREMEQIPAIRAATREELYMRLHLARDFMEANLNLPLTVPEIAQQACLSTHHFLRMFKQVFQETPHQYLTRRRMERARQMLILSDVSVTQICFALGFESLGSFSWLFRARTGLSPEQFRLQARRGVALSLTERVDRPDLRSLESGGSLMLGMSLAPKDDKPTEGF
ncbi:MAG: transcriptional regulator, AraC family, partial [Chthonomonadales bacterium]|nr:transcriptional regulator, AraC family [Chthonomonadales bacterium]